MLDVAGTPRCCEADCRLSGRVCSTTGDCVCASQYQDVGGLCLLEQGQPCRTDDECANSHCTDNVCCDAACDNVCERCDDPTQVGTCSLYAQDPACVELTNFACIARNRCRLPPAAAAFSCRSDLDCESDHCEPALSGPALCCATECDGVCERCTASGVCSFPEADPACPPVAPCPANETCLAYRLPNAGECSSSGQCATRCEPLPQRAGIPCGVGQQCDGNGECRVTALGRVAAGTRHTCAILDSGNVRCWGDNTLGQLGVGFERPSVGQFETPAASGLEINFGRKVVQITAGFAHTCVLFEQGEVRCWGSLQADRDFGSMAGVLGTDVIGLHASGFVDPLATGDVRLPEAEAAVQISAANGGAHTCAVTASGQVYCWGRNAKGQCGVDEALLDVGGTNNPLRPVVLDPEDLGARALQVAAGDEHTCALSSGGRVSCWGSGFQGQLGYGDNSDRSSPPGSVAVGEPVTQIAAGYGHTCALLERGRVRCWGSNEDGTLGYGHAINIGDDETPERAVTLPQAPASTAVLGGDALIGGGNVVQIVSVVESHSVCARFQSGVVRCWGENDDGELGYGHIIEDGYRFSPEQLVFRPANTAPDGSVRFVGGDVALGGDAVALADGGRCALVRPSGSASASSAPLALYCWGVHEDGQLGLPRLFSSDPAEFGINSSNNTPVELGPVLWE
jgi:alpha-tubulin suppressor-like RCC1 family protein